MRSVKRIVAVSVLGLPLLFGAPGMAFACGHGKPSPSISQDQDLSQDQDASTAQSNSNRPVMYVFNVGKGDQNVVSWNHQATDADTDQTQAGWQQQED
ncbi:hypothetical protein [Saccharopolyspora phatthalungensis]|uniref:Lipoprotein n=1 Tax=Saccharopolyspora phatthalungensis TaxID=664693 RepID=A0A840QDC8_9PSEU|nr:hypothetical protein [Saccharopolyspora phatthalungensis]MBB5158774.1 hypothetical protein [Saccharopolyspora phatthalungensis]